MATYSGIFPRCNIRGIIGECCVGGAATIIYVSHHCCIYSLFMLGSQTAKNGIWYFRDTCRRRHNHVYLVICRRYWAIVAAFIKQLEVDRFRTVATFAMAMSLQHGVKIVVFEGMGVSLADWWPLLVCMMLSGTVGTWIGFKMLKRVADKHFQTAFSIVLTLLAIRLIWQAISQW